MSNPLKVATKGKGFLPMLARGMMITNRYGLTAGKMDGALGKLDAIVQQYACFATLPVTASALASNPSVALKYHKHGQELAIHGFQHLDYSLLSKEKQLEHLQVSMKIFQNAGIPIAGFRCPYLRWNADTLTALSESGFTYDSSQALECDVLQGLETDAYRHVLGFYQAQSAHDYPALPRMVNGLVRIPYCLPDDEALVERLHLSRADTMAEIWLKMLEYTYQAGELFTLGLHPERVLLCQQALMAVLEKARSLSPRVWIARLDEIANWYLSLGRSSFEIRHETGDVYHVRIDAPANATILIRSLDVITPSQPWIYPFQTIMENKFTARSNKRPVIGISPDSPSALQQFLRHQGYFIEISPNRQDYSCYLDNPTFHEEDERPLISKIEQENTPLIRLSRWPDKARSGLAITGDVDAFTIWDYGRRVLYN